MLVLEVKNLHFVKKGIYVIILLQCYITVKSYGKEAAKISVFAG